MDLRQLFAWSTVDVPLSNSYKPSSAERLEISDYTSFWGIEKVRRDKLMCFNCTSGLRSRCTFETFGPAGHSDVRSRRNLTVDTHYKNEGPRWDRRSWTEIPLAQGRGGCSSDMSLGIPFPSWMVSSPSPRLVLRLREISSGKSSYLTDRHRGKFHWIPCHSLAFSGYGKVLVTLHHIFSVFCRKATACNEHHIAFRPLPRERYLTFFDGALFCRKTVLQALQAR